MNFNLISGYPIWYYLLCAIVGLLVSGALYYRSKQFDQLPKWVVPSMFTFRWIMVSFISFLLLDPVIKTFQKESQKPIIVLAQDNSSSIILHDSAFYKGNYLQSLIKIKADLDQEFDVRNYTFGSIVKQSDSISFSEKETEFSGLFDEISAAYSNANLGAVIIASDGIFNQGPNPVFINPGFSAPVYTLGLGDTTLKKDLSILKVNHNQLVFRGNEFPVEVLINADQSKGEKAVLKLTREGKTLFTSEVTISSNRFNVNIPVLLTAEGEGTQKYSVSVSVLENEITVLNNARDFYIDVIDSRQKILIVTNAPHPDIAALREVLEKNENYDVILKNQSELKTLQGYDLVILNHLPVQSSQVSLFPKESAQSMLFILGGTTDLNKFNSIETGLKIVPSKGNPNEAIPVYNNEFSLFALSEEALDLIKKLPPLMAPYGNYNAGSGTSIFLRQKIGTVTTNYPLILFDSKGGGKTGVICGEGIWKWKLRDYAENQNHFLFEEIIGKIVQYLSVRADKSNFRVYNEKRFNENQEVILDAELYNESYELVNDPEVKVVINNAEGRSYPFTFTRTQKAYRLNAGLLPPGDYKYKATVVNKGKEYIKAGQFSVTRVVLESLRSRADHQLLFNLSKKNKGEFYPVNQMDSLVNAIKSREDLKTISYSTSKTLDLISLKWLFFLLITFISIEWFLRKYFGSY